MTDHCRHCGCLEFREEPGTGPHAAQLVCDGCGKHHRWLSAHGAGTKPLAPLWKNMGEGYGGTLKQAVTIPAGSRILLFKVRDPKPGGPALLVKWAPPEAGEAP